MAIYRLEAKIVGRSRGHSATAAAAYRARARIADERTGLVHDFTRRSGVEHTEILTPAHAPTWMREDRARLWNLVEATENRARSQLARELVLTLPRELSAEQRIAVTRAFVSSELVSLGMVADVAHHTGRIDANGLAQPHAHVLLSLREVTENGFSRHKARAWNSVEHLERWRAAWAAHLNEALRQAEIACAPLDHRSLAERRAEALAHSAAARAAGDENEALDLAFTAYALGDPEPKLGRARHLEDRGIESDQAPLVEAVRQERAQMRSRAEIFRRWLRKRVTQAAVATQDLGDRLRAGLTASALTPLRETNLALAGGRLASDKRQHRGPNERPHRHELGRDEVERRRVRQTMRQLLRELQRGREIER